MWAIGLGCTLLGGAEAKTIYQWVDENGRTQMSDVVPDKYKNSAKRIESSSFEPSAQEKREAEARAATLKARAQALAASAPRSGAAPARAAASAVTTSASGAPVDYSNCAAWRLRYRLSADCYARHTLEDGSLQPDAQDVCGPDIPSPVNQCGIDDSK